ncbi:MAG: biotin synthase BioB [Pseudomonadota bacterium]
MTTPRHDWTTAEAEALFEQPFNDLIFNAQTVHRTVFDPNTVQVSTLLSIKTGACPEDCKYCPQSARYKTGLDVEKILPLDAVLDAARAARNKGATRFCMGGAWRSPRDWHMEQLMEMVAEVKALGLETCLTVGMLNENQAEQLKTAGLDYYNHNIDTSPDYYPDVISTRQFEDRLDTLKNVREAGLKVCCGGIVGMGESRRHRADMLTVLANLPEHPESVPINRLVQVPGTPFHGQDEIDPLEFVRTIAVARLMLPRSMVRLSAGRTEMSDELQALCFLAGANSIFYGDKLLTTDNPIQERDQALFQRLGIEAGMPAPAAAATTEPAPEPEPAPAV